jgi:Protein of unknown function (DUF4065)
MGCIVSKTEKAIVFDESKFKELVLYISERSENDVYFGATKLNKVLFFSDTLAYGYFGKPITGATYQALPKGPAPKKLLPVRAQMIRDKELTIKSERVGRFIQKRPTALREPDLSSFTAEEIALVNQVIDLLRDRTASESSHISHIESMGWRIADEGEEIPYASVFLSARKPTKWHFERGREVASTIATA